MISTTWPSTHTDGILDDVAGRPCDDSSRTGHGCSGVVSPAVGGGRRRASGPAGGGVLTRATLRWRGDRHPRKKVLLAAPRGYCAGVDRAVIAVEKALELYGAPVYVRKEIVHNKHVVATLEERGAIFVDETDEVPEGALVDLLARTASRRRCTPQAAARQLQTIDATCPLVTKVHKEAVRFASDDYDILLIGHEGHEEVEGTAGEAPEHVQLVDGPDDVDAVHRARPRQGGLAVADHAAASTRRWRRCAGCASGSRRCRTRPATTSATPPRTARWP